MSDVRISEVAKRSEVPATTLRFYESIGLIASVREPNGYRSYDPGVLDQLSFVESAKHLNLTLPEIAELLRVVEADSCTQVREALRPVLEQRLTEVDARLADMQRLRDRLAGAVRQVGACPDSGVPCRSECMLLSDAKPSCGHTTHTWDRRTSGRDSRGAGSGN